jgi:hypothetical protein
MTRMPRARAEGRPQGRVEVAQAEVHHVENDVNEALPRQADQVIDATAPLEAVIAACLDAIERFASDESLGSVQTN